MSKTSKTIRMNVSRLWTGLYILGLTVSLWFSFVAFITGSIFTGIFLVLSALFMAYTLMLSFSYVQVDDTYLFLSRSLLGKHRIAWQEVTSAEKKGKTVLVRAPNKALGFNTLMGDRHAKSLCVFVEGKLQEHGIELVAVPKMKINRQEIKNTRIS